MNKATINRVFFVLLCLSDLFVVYSFYKLRLVSKYITALLGIALIILKYPIYEVCFAVINRKLVGYSVKSVAVSAIVEVVSGVLILVEFFTLNLSVVLQAKFLTGFITVPMKIFFLFCLVVLKGMLVIDVTVPASIGKIDF